jgi:hypothetical protein
MTIKPKGLAALTFEQAATLALKSAVKKAIAERTRAGLPVYVWKGGKVVDLNAPKGRGSVKSAKPSKTTARKTTKAR